MGTRDGQAFPMVCTNGNWKRLGWLGDFGFIGGEQVSQTYEGRHLTREREKRGGRCLKGVVALLFPFGISCVFSLGGREEEGQPRRTELQIVFFLG